VNNRILRAVRCERHLDGHGTDDGPITWRATRVQEREGCCIVAARGLAYENLGEMTALGWVMKRVALNPPVPWRARQACEGYRGQRYYIRPENDGDGTTTAIHSNRGCGATLTLEPERFSPRAVPGHAHRSRGMPFGGRSAQCIGRTFARWKYQGLQTCCANSSGRCRGL